MKISTSIIDRAKSLADPLELIERTSGLQAPHIKPLSDFVASLRARNWGSVFIFIQNTSRNEATPKDETKNQNFKMKENEH